MKKRTSVKREKLPPLMERYLQIIEGKIPPAHWPEILAANVTYNGARGVITEGFDAVAMQLARWHTVMENIRIEMIRMVEDLEAREHRGHVPSLAMKIDFWVYSDWVSAPEPGRVPAKNLVIGLYEVRDDKIWEIHEMWPRARIPPTVG